MAISLKENKLCSTGSVDCTLIQDQLNEVQSQLNIATQNVNSLTQNLNIILAGLGNGITLYKNYCCMDSTNSCNTLKCILPVSPYLGNEGQCQEICSNAAIDDTLLGDCSSTGVFSVCHVSGVGGPGV
jgi:hypothetical protein